MAAGNRLDLLFAAKNKGIVSIYCTAGFPSRDSLLPLLGAIQEAGADLIEIGMPFSDPVADGPTIQSANERALKNGMSLAVLFEQLAELRKSISIPVILMGYINPILQFGVEKFCEASAKVGVDGVILPDLPPELYLKSYREVFERSALRNVFLVSPTTSEERMRWIDSISNSFIYAVSSAAVTGGKLSFDGARKDYLARLAAFKLKSPVLVGFGVASREDAVEINKFANGVIIGSAFIRAIDSAAGAVSNPVESALNFVKGVVN